MLRKEHLASGFKLVILFADTHTDLTDGILSQDKG
jgi:hypothetical protein